MQVTSSFALHVAGVAVLTDSPLKLALNRESTRVDFPQPVSPASEQRVRQREKEGEGRREEEKGRKVQYTVRRKGEHIINTDRGTPGYRGNKQDAVYEARTRPRK